jgi:hypothetical protein
MLPGSLRSPLSVLRWAVFSPPKVYPPESAPLLLSALLLMRQSVHPLGQALLRA